MTTGPIEIVHYGDLKVMVGVIYILPTLPTKDGYGLPFVAHEFVNYN